MKFGTDDDRFVIQVARADGYTPEFFRLRLILDGHPIGRFEPEIVWAELTGLESCAEVLDPRFDPIAVSPERLYKSIAALSDQDREPFRTSLGASFDGCDVSVYRPDGLLAFVFRSFGQGSSAAHVVAVPAKSATEIIGAAKSHISQASQTSS